MCTTSKIVLVKVSYYTSITHDIKRAIIISQYGKCLNHFEIIHERCKDLTKPAGSFITGRNPKVPAEVRRASNMNIRRSYKIEI